MGISNVNGSVLNVNDGGIQLLHKTFNGYDCDIYLENELTQFIKKYYHREDLGDADIVVTITKINENNKSYFSFQVLVEDK